VTDESRRKLAVLLHADVVESTLLVRIDESVAHDRIRDAFQRFSGIIREHGGIAHEIRGDALVAEFSKASDAITAALEFQAANQEHNQKLSDDVCPQLRVGVAMGEVVIADNTVTGEGIVLAQRLEQLAEAGGICIQGAAYETIPKRLPFHFDNLGEKTLKGFSESIRVYAVKTQTEKIENSVPHVPPTDRLAMTQKPSIAVLPFTNMSGDAEQEYFSDGMTEDIITELSRFKTLDVIARHSSFAFKGEKLGIHEIGKKLKVQYVVEGSVRRVGNRVRITVQLIESESENHVWAERYDRDLEDIFELQDEVTSSMVAVLLGRIQKDVAERASRKPTENVKAYELMLQAKAMRDSLGAEDMAHARELLQKAVALDPGYARAFMYLGDTYVVDMWLGLAKEGSPELSLQLARKAAKLDGNDVFIQDHLGFAYLCVGQWENAEAQIARTLAKIVNEAESMAWCGYAYLVMGQHEKALEVVLEAMRLDPLHPHSYDWILGQVYYFTREYDKVISVLMGEALRNSLAHAFLVAAWGQQGHEVEAQAALATFIQQRKREFNSRGIEVGNDSIVDLAGGYRMAWRNADDWEHFIDGLRKAGLPD
jgi:adenylate cyclase